MRYDAKPLARERTAHLEAVKGLLAQEKDPEKKKALERARKDLEDR